MSERFAIVPERWYAFTMFPGYTDSPYASPIYVHTAEPLGGRRLRLEFFNAAYPTPDAHLTGGPRAYHGCAPISLLLSGSSVGGVG